MRKKVTNISEHLLSVEKEFYGKSKSETEAKKEAYKQDLKNGINHNLDESTVNDAFNFWLINVILPSGIKTSTYETYETIYRLYIKDSALLGIKKVSEVNATTIQQLLNDMNTSGKNYPLLSKTYKLIKRFFNYAIENYAILKNPCISVKVPGQIAYLKPTVESLVWLIWDFQLVCVKERY